MLPVFIFKRILLVIVIATGILISGCIPLQETDDKRSPDSQEQPSFPVSVPSSPSNDDSSGSTSDTIVEQQQPKESSLPPLVSPPAPVSPPSKEQVSCEDSDNGFAPAIAGTAVRTYQEEVTTFDDKCSNSILLEHYCEEGIVKTREVDCENGCASGACLSSQAVVISSQSQQDDAVDPSKEFYNCYNGFRDTQETDMDCGGPDCFGCGYGRRCNVNSDCAEPLVCNIRMKKCSDFRH